MRQVSGIWDNLPGTITSFLVNYLQRLFGRTEGVVFSGVRCVEVRFGNVTIVHCQLIEVLPDMLLRVPSMQLKRLESAILS